ncbi:hypothetical protein [Streptomyces sp. Z26]|uniref:hypothetical protein n=1 Tax=Streptomyces sp. Z26 TaxID=2500177 RepID=UPI000FCC886E|nr:hypothetical protein [Streptomyces sp. Z26]
MGRKRARGWRIFTAGRLSPGVSLSAVASAGADAAWAVDSFALVGRESRAVAPHWDGRRWHETVLPDVRVRLTGVHAESARGTWTTGFRTPVGDEGYEPRVLHWNGRAWRDVTGPVTGLSPRAIRGGVRVSGNTESWEGPPVLWHRERGRWTMVYGATVPGGETQAYDVTDLAPAGCGDRLRAVGGCEVRTGKAAPPGTSPSSAGAAERPPPTPALPPLAHRWVAGDRSGGRITMRSCASSPSATTTPTRSS